MYLLISSMCFYSTYSYFGFNTEKHTQHNILNTRTRYVRILQKNSYRGFRRSTKVIMKRTFPRMRYQKGHSPIVQFRVAQFPCCAVRVRIMQCHVLIKCNYVILSANDCFVIFNRCLRCYDIENMFESFEGLRGI